MIKHAPTVTATQPEQPRPSQPPGMACVDTSGSRRIALLMELVGALSRANDPVEVLRIFGGGIRRLHETHGYISLSTRGLATGEYRITRCILDGDIERFNDERPWVDADAFPVHSEGFLSQIVRTAYPELIHHLQIENDPVLGDGLTEFGSLIAIPLFEEGEPRNWAIHLHRDPEGFTEQDLEERILHGNLIGGTIRTVLMANELRAANKKIQSEVERIATIQRSLLPEQMPTIKGVQLAASYNTFDHAGGDYYDFLPLLGRDVQHDQAEGPWGIFIADASGHGPAAAVMMAMLHAILHAYPHYPEGPAEVLSHLNSHIWRKRIEGSFVTAFFGIYDPSTNRFQYARAGHNPPLLKNPGAGGSVSRLDDVGGLPLGVMEDSEYSQAEIQLKPAQSVVFYTDGITEAFNPHGEMFDVQGIEAALTQCTGEPTCVVDTITRALEAHEQTVRPSDDQTLVVMQVDM